MNAIDVETGLRELGRDHDLRAAARAAVRIASEDAARNGDAAVAYAAVASPLGDVVIAATDRGVLAVNLPGLEADELLERIAELISPRIVEAPGRLDRVRRQLDEYFESVRQDFQLNLDHRLIRPGFTAEVLTRTAEIPYGQTLSYGELAELSGRPRAYRAAGTALGSNPIPIIVPCHRVLRAGGAVGHYGGGSEMKRWLLEHEGALAPDPAHRG